MPWTDAGKYTTLAESTDPLALGNLMNEHIDSNLRIDACRAALDIQKAVTRFNDARGQCRLGETL
ncbi:hypothetical protein [Methylocaldum marinum]|uniref:hypothetical protein n=1 Tax=Methylocaldum marinum TaxID=1432792 RepID=UPI000E68DE6D|nr:hypothetical protein [Methylocaldum marinum]